MRKKSKNENISVHAIAGTEVVLMGLNATEEACKGLLGFSIYKKTGSDDKFKPLSGGKIFKGASQNKIGSDVAPIQSFLWSDYVVSPDTKYTYRVVPMYGSPGALKPGKKVEVNVRTEDTELGKQAVYFNRGVAGSQAYSRSFGKYLRWYITEQFGRKSLKDFVKPKDIPNRAAYKWLSRGLEEGMLNFIRQANGPEYSIRAAVYELTYAPAIQAFVDALESGADVKVIHHSKKVTSYAIKTDKTSTITFQSNGKDVVFPKRTILKSKVTDSVGAAADEAITSVGIVNPDNAEKFQTMFKERTNTTISHNKFVILLKNDKPLQVWTGSTNFTEGGIFGQSNVGHIVREKDIAQKYLDYWNQLYDDPKAKEARKWTVETQPDLIGPPPPNSITPIFSPRATKGMLDWYADRLDNARSSVFFTAAFSVANEIFEKVIKEKKAEGPYLRYLLLEGIGGLIKPKFPAMKKISQNRIAWGEIFNSPKKGEPDHHQLIETLTGLNENVNFLHTKYMLIDPLTDDPIVITGSANFSEASTRSNDENMLIIRGNTRVADIFLGEFMRMFRHFETRNKANRLTKEEKETRGLLSSDDSWTQPYYEEGSPLQVERMLFS